MTATPTPPMEDDVKAIRDALSDYSQWAGRPTVLENALAHIDAQAEAHASELRRVRDVRNENAEDARREIASLRELMNAQAVRLDAAERDAERLNRLLDAGRCDSKHGAGFSAGTTLRSEIEFRYWVPREIAIQHIDAAIASEATT